MAMAIRHEPPVQAQGCRRSVGGRRHAGVELRVALGLKRWGCAGQRHWGCWHWRYARSLGVRGPNGRPDWDGRASGGGRGRPGRER